MATDYTATNIGSGVGQQSTINAEWAAIQAALERVLNVYGDSTNGTNAMQVDLDMNSQKILNVPAPTLVTDLVRLGDLSTADAADALTTILNDAGGNYTSDNVEGALTEIAASLDALAAGTPIFSVAGGTVDAITASLTPAITSYTDGLQINVRAAGANATTTPTLNIDSVGAKTIKKIGNQALRIGDIPKADYECIFRYNSTNDVFELLNPALYPPLSGETGVTNYEYPYGYARRYGASPGTASDQSTKLQNWIDSCAAINVRGEIDADSSGNLDYRIDSGLTMAADDLAIDFLGGAYLKPVDSSLLVPLTIGGTASPSRMIINNPSVQRASYDGGTENIGIKFLELNQSTVTNPESRLSKYNLVWSPTSGGSAYNTFINPQGIGGFYNLWLDASGTGWTNENVFVGGRGFCTSDTDTNLRLDNGGLGTGHNRFIGVSLEGQGVQGIYDDGDANEFHSCRPEGTWSSGFFHVMGTNCQYSLIVSSRIDYSLDTSGATDPREQYITYKLGSKLSTAINLLTTLTLENQSASRGSGIDIYSTRDNDDAYAWRSVRKIVSASGTHDGANNAATLTDSGESWSTNAFVDGIIFNTTDKSHGIITANTATTITATLAGGTDNDWDSGDSYIVYLFNGVLKTNGEMQLRRRLEVKQSGYNFEPIQFGNCRVWLNDESIWFNDAAAPSSATDGFRLDHNQSAPAVAGLQNIANVVNTNNKYAGKMVWDSTNGRPVWAAGSAAGDVWVDHAGTTVHTPS